MRCPYCPALLGGEEELQEHCAHQHFGPGGKAFGCSLCPLLCPSQQQLQEHYLACHVEALVEQAGRGATDGEGGEGGGGGEEEGAEEEEEPFISGGAVRDLYGVGAGPGSRPFYACCVLLFAHLLTLV